MAFDAGLIDGLGVTTVIDGEIGFALGERDSGVEVARYAILLQEFAEVRGLRGRDKYRVERGSGSGWR